MNPDIDNQQSSSPAHIVEGNSHVDDIDKVRMYCRDATRSILNGYSHASCALESDAHALTYMYPRIVKDLGYRMWQTSNFKHIVQLGSPRYSLSSCTDSDGKSRALYPAEARARMMSVKMEISAEIMHKCYKKVWRTFTIEEYERLKAEDANYFEDDDALAAEVANPPSFEGDEEYRYEEEEEDTTNKDKEGKEDDPSMQIDSEVLKEDDNDDLPSPSSRVKRSLAELVEQDEDDSIIPSNKKKKKKISSQETSNEVQDQSKDDATTSQLPQTTKGKQKQYVRKCFWKLLSIDKVLAPLAMDFVQQMGSACRVKRSGHFCHEDPDDLGGYYICDGVERYIENSLDMRTNYARTYFYTKRDARYDNTNLIECDYRANLDYTQKKASAFHLYLVVPNKIAHLHSRGIFKHMQSASSDAPPTTSSSSSSATGSNASEDTANHILFDFIPAAPPSSSSSSNEGEEEEGGRVPPNFGAIPNIGLSSNGRHGVNFFGSIFPAITVSLQNVNTTNLNLVGFFFLLGANTRADMMRIILPFLGNDWPEDDEISSNDHPLQILADRSAKRLDQQHLALARTAYGVIYLQHVIPRYDSVPIEAFEVEGSVLCDVHHYLRDGPESLYPMPFPSGEFGEAEKVASYQARVDGWSRHMLLAYITSVMSGTNGSSKTASTSENNEKNDGNELDEVSHVTTTSSRSGPSAALSAAMPATRKRQLDQFKTRPWLQSFERMKRSIFAENMPNIGTDNSWITRNTKQRLTGSIVLKILTLFQDLIEIEDVDHMNGRRIPGCGVVKSDLFRMTIQKGIGELCDAISKQAEEGKIFQFKALAERYFNSTLIHSVMATGKWPVSTGSFDRSGVTKVHSYCSAAVNAEHIRRVCNNNLAPRSKEKGVHEFQESSSGILCTHHTPADEAAGIVTYLANGVRLRTGYDVETLRRTILNCERHGIIPMKDVLELVTNSHSTKQSPSSAKRNRHQLLRLHWNLNAESVLVFINGHPVGYSSNPQRTCAQLRYSRLNYGLPCDVSIAWVGGPIYNNGPLQSPYYNFISILGDAGGQVVPVFNLSNLWKLPLVVETFRYNHAHALDALIENGVLEYLDIEERSYMQIAKNCFHEVTKRSNWWLLHPNDPHRVCVISDVYASLPKYSSSSSSKHYKLSNHILFSSKIPLVLRHSVAAPAPFTHAYVGGDLLTGIVASLIPYVNNSNANRITFGSGMKQQLMGVMPLNSAYRLRSTNLTMMLPKRSLVPTLISETLCVGGVAGGSLPKLIVIMCHKLNAEDETVHKRADYGQSTFIHRSFNTSTIKVSAARYQASTAAAASSSGKSTVVKGSDPSIFSKPDTNTVLGLRATSYHALHEDGSPKIGAVVEPGHARIGRTFVRSEYDHSSKSNIIVVRDKSEINQSKLTEIVSSVMKTTTDHGHGGGPIMHVFSESARLIDSGNKGCTKSGQKGVLGFVSKPEDMPYMIIDDRGITPDIIMNPHAIPSRTTVGQPKESQQASIVLNATGLVDVIDPWQGMSMSEQMELLNSAGCNYQGTDYMYDGVTGSRTQILVFRGFLEYSFLWHLALEKCKSRSTGGIDVRTRQPTAGGKNTGGNRDGPMEAANKHGHGATYVVNQAMNTASNTVKTLVCNKCCMPATPYPRPSTAALRLIASSVCDNSSSSSRSNAEKQPSKSNIQKRRDFFSGGYCHICKSWQSVVPVDLTSSILVTSKEVNTEGIAWPLHLSRHTNDWSSMSDHQLASRVLMS